MHRAVDNYLPRCTHPIIGAIHLSSHITNGAKVTYPSNEGASAELINGMLNLGGLIILVALSRAYRRPWTTR
jgi:hypothetical protein